MIEALRNHLFPTAGPGRVSALALGMLVGGLASAFLDVSWVAGHWAGIAAILAASCAVSISHVYCNALPIYLRRHADGDDAFEGAYRTHTKACAHYAGTVGFAVFMLLFAGPTATTHSPDVAWTTFRVLVGIAAGLLACDAMTIVLTLQTFLTTPSTGAPER